MSLGLNTRSIVRLLIRAGNCALVELGALIRLILLSASNLVQDIIVYMRCTVQRLIHLLRLLLPHGIHLCRLRISSLQNMETKSYQIALESLILCELT